MGKVVKLTGDWHRKIASKRVTRAPVVDSTRRAQDKRDEILLASRPMRGSSGLKILASEKSYTVSEVAKILGFDESTIYEWVRDGVIHGERHGPTGRSVRISESALVSYRRDCANRNV